MLGVNDLYDPQTQYAHYLTQALRAKELFIKAGGSLQSENYYEGMSGFKIDWRGNAEFNSGRFRGGLGIVSNAVYPDHIINFGSGCSLFIITSAQQVDWSRAQVKPIAIFVASKNIYFSGGFQDNEIYFFPIHIESGFSLEVKALGGWPPLIPPMNELTLNVPAELAYYEQLPAGIGHLDFEITELKISR